MGYEGHLMMVDDRDKRIERVASSMDLLLAAAGDVRAVAGDLGSALVGAEFVGASISSEFPEQFIDIVEAAAESIPELAFLDASRRGYGICILTREAATVTFRFVDDARDATSEVQDGPSFEKRPGQPVVEI